MKELVIFDIDDTIIKGQSQKFFLEFLFKKNYISLFYYLRLTIWFIFYKLGLIKNPKSAMKYAFSFVKGKTEAEISDLVDLFFDSVLQNKIYPEAINIIEKHQKEGRIIVLMSNAVDVLVRKIASHLKIDNFISTKLELVNGVYTGNIIGNIMYGETKKEAILSYVKARNLQLDNSWAYGDHFSDIFLLSLVKNPYAVNPSKDLKRYAKLKEWGIINF